MQIVVVMGQITHIILLTSVSLSELWNCAHFDVNFTSPCDFDFWLLGLGSLTSKILYVKSYLLHYSIALPLVKSYRNFSPISRGLRVFFSSHKNAGGGWIICWWLQGVKLVDWSWRTSKHFYGCCRKCIIAYKRRPKLLRNSRPKPPRFVNRHNSYLSRFSVAHLIKKEGCVDCLQLYTKVVMVTGCWDDAPGDDIAAMMNILW